MSYGRSPYYIFGTRGWNGTDVIQFIEPQGSISRGEWPYTPTDKEGKGASVVVADDAIAQLIHHIAMRGTEELQAWIDRGAALNDDYTDFEKGHPAEWVREEYAEYRKAAQSVKVTVEVGE